MNLHLVSKTKITTIFFAMTLIASTQNVSAVEPPVSFDKPSSIKRLPLPKDLSIDYSAFTNSDTIPEVACFYYPNFMVKQIDLGEKGAEELSITPNEDNGRAPTCQYKPSHNTHIIALKAHTDDAYAQGGYFTGVKGPYVFFENVDGNLFGGYDFFVFDGKSAKMLFVDGASYMSTEQMHVIEASASRLSLRYTRSYELPCSVSGQAAGECKQKVKRDLGLRFLPSCINKYEAGDGIHYRVNAVIENGKPAQIIPARGKKSCAQRM